jgi:homoserine O-acetyltransferase
MSGPLTHRVHGFRLESGDVLDEVVQGYRLWGTLNEERDNLVVVFHALTGSPDAADWWRGVIGPGLAIDTTRHAVVCANLLGSCYGTVAPWQRDGTALSPVTPRDQARLIRALVDELGAASVALATGGSLGGMVALEWAALFPERARSVVVFAAPAAHTASAIGWNHVQRTAIRAGGAQAGLALARMVGMLTYRTGDELERRFGRREGVEGFAVRDYLSRHGERLVERFDAAGYLTLLDAMDAHDVGAGRGGIGAALGAVRGRLIGVGIPGDLLYSEKDVRRWTDEAGAEYREIHSEHGHDAFLLEPDQVGALLAEVLAGVAPAHIGDGT